jgi:hypothetical protein
MKLRLNVVAISHIIVKKVTAAVHIVIMTAMALVGLRWRDAGQPDMPVRYATFKIKTKSWRQAKLVAN